MVLVVAVFCFGRDLELMRQNMKTLIALFGALLVFTLPSLEAG